MHAELSEEEAENFAAVFSGVSNLDRLVRRARQQEQQAKQLAKDPLTLAPKDRHQRQEPLLGADPKEVQDAYRQLRRDRGANQ